MNSTRMPQSGGRRRSRLRGDGLLLSCGVLGLAAGLLAPASARAAGECDPRLSLVTCERPGGDVLASPALRDRGATPFPIQDLTVAPRAADAILPPRTSTDAGPSAPATDFERVLRSRDVTVVATGTVVTTGDYEFGVAAITQPGGDARATAENVTTSGYRAHAVYAVGDAATATVNGDLRTSGVLAAGVIAQGFDGRATVINDGSIATTGNGGIGIFAYGSEGVTISGAGTVSTAGPGAGGMVVNGYNGDTSITASSVTTTGDYSRGVSVSGSGDIVADLGEVTTSGRISSAIDVATFQNGTGPLDADLVLRVDKVTVDGDYSQGILAFTSNTGVLDIDAGSVAVHGVDGVGVQAESFTADITINAGSVVTTGRGDAYNGPIGISAVSVSGDIAITTNLVSTDGLNGTGIVARTDGAVTIGAGRVETRGDNAAAVLATGDRVAVTIGGQVSTTGANASGLAVQGRSGASVTNNGAITTVGPEANGISVDGGAGDVIVSGVGGVTTRGESSAAILARSAGGAITVTSGAIQTAGVDAVGIDAASDGDVTVDVETVSTRGDGSTGIRANGASVAVSAGAVQVRGLDAVGVDATAAGDVTLDVGSVRASEKATTAIRAVGGGRVDVSVSGAVRSDSGMGVSLDAGLDGVARLAVLSGGSIVGGMDAVAVASAGEIAVTNAGTIAGGDGYALRIDGGAATIVNTGEIRGRLRLTEGADTLTNEALVTLTGISDFGAGADTLVNTGVIRLATTGAAQTVSVAGLEVLNGGGAIELRNGVAGDRLTFAGTAFSGGGDAALGIDVAFAGGVATTDRLALGSAAGSTAVSLAVSGTPTLIAPTTIVEVAGDSAPGAFAIAPNSAEQGLIAFGVAFDPTRNAYQLVSAPGAIVYRQARLGEALTTLWNRSADAVSARLAAARDEPGAGGDRLWLQTLGEADTRRDRRSVDVSGVAQDGMNLSYRQDAFGVQLGVDLVRGSPEGGFSAGLTGGYLNSTTRFSASGAERFTVDAGNVGLYAGFRSGPVFVDGLAKYDFYKVGRRSRQLELDGEDDAHAWGGKIEAGLRLGSAGVFAEPRVSLAYSRAALEDVALDGGAFDFERFTGLRGKAGLRLGRTAEIGGSTAVFYLDGSAVKEFEGRGGLRFTSGGRTLDVRGDRLGVYGQGALGMTVTMASGVSGFLEGHGEFGKEYRGGGGRAGLRIGF